MNDACARPGCGAPLAWHTNESSIATLAKWDGMSHSHASIDTWQDNPEGHCLGDDCSCTAYLAPEPPKPERRPFVVMLDEVDCSELGSGETSFMAVALRYRNATPLADYLRANPQPCTHHAWMATPGGASLYQCAVCKAQSDANPQPARYDRATEYHGQPWPPQPAPVMCVCGGAADDHDPVTGRCSHVAKRVQLSIKGAPPVVQQLNCACSTFEAVPE